MSIQQIASLIESRDELARDIVELQAEASPILADAVAMLARMDALIAQG